MSTFIFGLLFLLYFWYFYFSYSNPVSKPTSQLPNPPPYDAQFSGTKHQFQFRVNGNVVWNHDIPEPYEFHRGRIIERDACHTQSNTVEAKGLALHNYLKTHPLPMGVFEENASSIVQKGNVFYFTCRNGRIHGLERCPAGQTYLKGQCRPIQSCTGQPDGIQLRDPNNVFGYIVCQDQQEMRQECPDETFFLFNTCRSINDLIYYCELYSEPVLVNPRTKMSCDRGKTRFDSCPRGFRYFDVKGKCESEECVGKPNGIKLAQSETRQGPFRYSPGYIDCSDDRIKNNITCPQNWDTFLSKGDNLSHLPMVFDGQQCSVPAFGMNVFSDDPDTMVPAHDFTKLVRNWQHSEYMDSFTGYTVENNRRRRSRAPPGQRIKRFKLESACDDQTLLPIPNQSNQFYNCATRQVETCQPGKKFDGFQCKTMLEHPFSFNNIDLFQYTSLSHDNWIQPWNYSKDPPIPQPCPDSEPIHMSNYNLCSDAACVPYPFLSQTPNMPILLPDKESKCVFHPTERLLKRETVDFGYHFWSQRQVPEHVPTDQDPCVSGSRIQSGHFVWDSSVYATCDYEQPFVFCPANTGLIQIDGQRYVCNVPTQSDTSVFYKNEWTMFQDNEIKTILPLNPNTTIRINKGPSIVVPPEGIEIPENTRLNLLVGEPVFLKYRYRVTHPPDAVFEDGHPRLSSSTDTAFLAKRKDFTKQPLNFPTYEVEPFVSEFEIKDG